MLFNSWTFLVFFLVVYLAYLQVQHRTQNHLLLLASYVFYAYWDYQFLGLILLSTIVDYGCGLALESSTSARHRKLLVWTSAAVNLGILATFKYLGFFVDNAVVMLQSFGLAVSERSLELLLPVGISFYTFQTLGYTIDVYHRRCRACRRLDDFALYVTFFPQLVAGPIERASHLIGQIRAPRILTPRHISLGVRAIILGFFWKVVIADNAARIADAAFVGSDPSFQTAWTGVYAFTLQIYGDFAGYSSIAIGLAYLLGIELVSNFRQPYLATNPSDFWERWHISLSSWLRDYLYIPLGGNRHGRLRTLRNLLVTMVLGGLWHGAAWNFVLWGIYHGILLIVFRMLAPITKPRQAREWTQPIRVVGYLHLTLFGWMIFRCESLDQVIGFARAMVDFGPLTFDRSLMVLSLLGIMVLLIDLLLERGAKQSVPAQRWLLGAGRVAAHSSFVLLIYLVGSRGGSDFIYFQF